ncbi:response regulator [Dawidia soli]|uniref:Response regulatory domain-containing protein n=1 Tax=Dawidia soli TaxID=2782352 RepID=A0AAP2D8A4_9BACT|nr:hypothetical protein [Dawidia soli]MBT1686441.1 hypothetical protein [Dawidia soli]
MKRKDKKSIGTGRSFLFINSNPVQQFIFIEAIAAIAPTTQLFLAEDAMEALDVMVEKGLIPDIIMIEFKMKRINALTFLREIKKICSLQNVPVIVHSRRPATRHIDELKALGAHGLYFKSYDYKGVCNVINIFVQERFSICLN